MEEEIQQLNKRIANLERLFQDHRHSGIDSKNISFSLAEATETPAASVSSPAGGMTQDTQARSAIDDIITRLETLNLITAN